MTKESGYPGRGRLLRPGKDTLRIAIELGSCSISPSGGVSNEDPGVAAVVETIIRQRSMRTAHLPADLLGDPAWDMLLALYLGELKQRGITTAALCAAAGVSQTGGARWIDALVAEDLCARTAGPERVRLTERGSKAMRAYVVEFGSLWS